MSEIVNVEIITLKVEQATELSEKLLSAPGAYSKYFTPFDFDRLTISKILSKARKDTFFGVYIAGKIVGFFMLRGLDKGYKIPSYGVWIAPSYTGKGLGELTLKHAVAFCRVNGIEKLMLKVHPENIIAKKLYERNGFTVVGNDEMNGNIIYHKKCVTEND